MSKEFSLIVTGVAFLLTLIAIVLPKKYKEIAIGLCMIAATIVLAGIIVMVLI